MRTEFIEELTRLAERDDRICLVVGDLGFGVVVDFAKRFPDRFLNVGIAEQAMTGLAAGWALSGKVVFTYSIANFPTLRCLEQIRNDACYHGANVKIVAVGGGFAYGALGATHHATEDLAVLRAMPGMRVVAPGDTVEARLATRAVADLPGPCYLRIGRAGEPTVHDAEPEFRIGRAITVREGTDVAILSTGGMLKTAVDAAELLGADGISARVVSMHTLHPIDEGAILRASAETGAVLTLEEHSIVGGLGGAVAEVLAESASGVPFRRLGTPPRFAPRVGSQEFMLRQSGLTPPAVAEAARGLLLRHAALGPLMTVPEG
ncbi:transketolase family protein [Tautonia sociabilis]|uniref:Transketolase n=1 Tax=Tautonia sociabilis TaxID=2080755 RepID=A0A432MJQ9_9BACT|nr:transketolase C-terminal domain-containing protein [Tautonia sociabilis]RUL87631.1 transketolase [Tautonia sociabilis]